MSEVNDEMIKAVLQIMRAAKTLDTVQPTVTQPQPPTLFDKLETGQLYQVTVLNPNVDGKALLRILGEKILVDTTLPLKQGQHLTVEVVSKGDVIQLQLKLSPTHEDIKAQYLKLTLPKQQPVADLIKNLNDYLAGLSANRTSTPSQLALQSLMRDFISQLPTGNELKDPAIFKKLLADSGIFLETNLARGQLPQTDLKVALLQIAQQLRPQITETLQKTAAMTAYSSASSTATSTSGSANIASQTAVAPAPTAAAPTGTANKAAAGTAATAAGSGTGTSARPLPADVSKTPQPAISGQVQKTDSTGQTASNPQAISQIKGVTEKGGLTATQAAQKASMLAKSQPARLIQSITANLMNNAAIQTVLNLLPKTELQLLLKQILFKNLSRAEQLQSSTASQRVTQLELLLRSVESGLARIQTQQLASVPQDDTTRQVWQLELPLRDQKELQALMMRIEQDDSNTSEESGSTWTVSLNFNIGQLGHIHSRIRLTSEIISTHFWAEEEKTLQKISSHLPRLSQALEKLGLSVNHMTAALGKPPDPVEIAATEAALLDENA